MVEEAEDMPNAKSPGDGPNRALVDCSSAVGLGRAAAVELWILLTAVELWIVSTLDFVF